MKELNRKARALLQATEGADEPSAADFDRVRAAVVARLAVGAAVGAAVTATAKTATAAASTAGATASATVAGAGAAAGAAVVAAPVVATAGAGVTAGLASSLPVMKVVAWVVAASMTAGVGTAVVVSQSRTVAPTRVAVPSGARQAPPAWPSVTARQTRSGGLEVTAAPAPEAPPASTVATPVGLPPETIPEPAPVAPPRPQLARATAGSAPTASSASFAADLDLLRDANESLKRGDAQHALAILDEHARRYPGSALTEERELLQIRATCTTGQGDAARELAARFLAAHPGSTYASSVKAACPELSPIEK